MVQDLAKINLWPVGASVLKPDWSVEWYRPPFRDLHKQHDQTESKRTDGAERKTDGTIMTSQIWNWMKRDLLIPRWCDVKSDSFRIIPILWRPVRISISKQWVLFILLIWSIFSALCWTHNTSIASSSSVSPCTMFLVMLTHTLYGLLEKKISIKETHHVRFNKIYRRAAYVYGKPPGTSEILSRQPYAFVSRGDLDQNQSVAQYQL